jgi:hypothetical protein
MSVGWTKIVVCLAVTIGYAQQLFAGTPGIPFERVIWPDDPDQIEAYCDLRVLLMKSFERWNAHDIDGFMDAIVWKSDDFVTTLDGSTIRGRRQILAAYRKGYSDPNTMGVVECSSLATNLLSPDLALVLFGWSQTIDCKKTIGSSSMLAAKFPFGWRVISNESEFHLRMPFQTDPRQLRPETIVPFGLRDRLTVPGADPKDLFVNRDHYYRGPIQLTMSLER